MQKIILQPSEFDSYDRLADVFNSAPTVQYLPTTLSEEVASDFRERRNAIETQACDLRIGADLGRHIGLWIKVLFLWAVGFFAIFVARFSLWIAAILLVTVGLGVWARLAVTRRARKRGDIKPSTRGRCFGCEYDLTGLSDSIPYEWITAHVGPRRCPECGEPWPLVPRSA